MATGDSCDELQSMAIVSRSNNNTKYHTVRLTFKKLPRLTLFEYINGTFFMSVLALKEILTNK